MGEEKGGQAEEAGRLPSSQSNAPLLQHVRTASAATESQQPCGLKAAGHSPSIATPLPGKQVAALMLVQAMEAINMSILFPFLPFMVEDLGYTGKHLGPAAGLLASAFCGAQVCSALPWGWVVDRYGRIPSLTVGLIGSAVASIYFGTATTYRAAFLGRFCAGLLNGNLAAVKSIMAQVTDGSNRTRGFSMLSLAWGAGVIVAPVLGGLLCRPADRYPDSFPPGSLFATYPYLLPCVGAVAVTVVTVVFCLAWLREPPGQELNAHKHKPTRSENGTAKGKYAPLSTADTPRSRQSSPAGGGGVELPRFWRKTMVRCDTEATVCSSDDEETIVDESGALDCELGVVTPSAAVGTDADSETVQLMARDKACDPESEPEKQSGDASAASSSSGGVCSRDVVICVAGYTVLAMAHVLYDETLPLWCKLSAAQGGLGFDSAQIGLLLSLGGLSLVVITMFVMPRMGKAGYLWMLRVGTLWTVPLFTLYPAQALLVRSDGSAGPLLWTVLIIGAVWRQLVSTMAFTAIIVLLNHTVPSHRLGVVNGLGQLFASIARTIGPATGGLLWSFSVRVHFVYANFVLAGVMLLATFLFALITPTRLEKGFSE